MQIALCKLRFKVTIFFQSCKIFIIYRKIILVQLLNPTPHYSTLLNPAPHYEQKKTMSNWPAITRKNIVSG